MGNQNVSITSISSSDTTSQSNVLTEKRTQYCASHRGKRDAHIKSILYYLHIYQSVNRSFNLAKLLLDISIFSVSRDHFWSIKEVWVALTCLCRRIIDSRSVQNEWYKFQLQLFVAFREWQRTNKVFFILKSVKSEGLHSSFEVAWDHNWWWNLMKEFILTWDDVFSYNKLVMTLFEKFPQMLMWTSLSQCNAT